MMILRCAVVALALIAVAGVASGQGDRGEVKVWAVLIAVQDYESAGIGDLAMTGNDVAELSRVLRERAGLPPERMLVLSDHIGSGDPGAERTDVAGPATLERMSAAVPEFLKGVGSEDRVIIYYSGHGARHDDQTYLLPVDCDLERFEQTAMPASALRSALEDCPAEAKFLVLDCCHAGGGAKGTASFTVDPQQLAKGMKVEPVARCVVLASSQAHETSLIWRERGQSIFTYWLCRALEGGADENADGDLELFEIYRYIFERVPRTAQALNMSSQTPTWTNNLQPGLLPFVSLEPDDVGPLCRRLAVLLDLDIRAAGLGRVGVIQEFLNEQGGALKLGSVSLPAYCAEAIRRELDQLSGDGAYEIVYRERMRDASDAIDLRPEQLQRLDRGMIERLSKDVEGIDGLVTGSLGQFQSAGPDGDPEDRIKLDCKLIAMPRGNVLGTASGSAFMAVDNLGDLGRSFVAQPGRDGREQPDVFEAPIRTVSQAAQAARDDHPLRSGALERELGLRLELEVCGGEDRPDGNWQPLDPHFMSDRERGDGRAEPRDNVMIVGVRSGQWFRIRVWNLREDRVAMAFLIDGKDHWGREPTRLKDANLRVLSPPEKGKQPQPYTFDSWRIPRSGDQPVAGERLEGTRKLNFYFEEVSDDVFSRESYGDSIGLITVAFYDEDRTRDRALVVGGREVQKPTPVEVEEFVPGRVLAIVNVRYIEEGKLETLRFNLPASE